MGSFPASKLYVHLLANFSLPTSQIQMSTAKAGSLVSYQLTCHGQHLSLHFPQNLGASLDLSPTPCPHPIHTQLCPSLGPGLLLEGILSPHPSAGAHPGLHLYCPPPTTAARAPHSTLMSCPTCSHRQDSVQMVQPGPWDPGLGPSPSLAPPLLPPAAATLSHGFQHHPTHSHL